MKNRGTLIGLLILLATEVVFGAEEGVLRKWQALSARSQNLQRQLMIVGRDAVPDPSTHKVALKGIDEALDDLVAAGELVSTRIKIDPPSEANEESYEGLFGVVERLSMEFGFFVAAEMCDLGARLRFIGIMPDEEFELHLRLPEKDLETFLTEVESLGLLKTKKAEQAAAGDPVKRPNLK
ncbi:MAG: hypothetical protein Q7R22_015120 [Verrucomicrobiota bacterium JB025]|nr:hypothetical protein [Verrucomicrobiota bacterium JB025]